MENQDPATEHLVLSTGSVETTPNHPFFTTDHGWIEAGYLVPGEKVRTADGSDATVVSFTSISTQLPCGTSPSMAPTPSS